MKRLIQIALTFILCTALFSVIISAAVEKAPINSNINVNIVKSENDVILDGIISEGEYGKLAITNDMCSYLVGSEADWIRCKSFKFNAYAAYDSAYLYFAVSYSMPKSYYKTDSSDKNMWEQSCLMISAAPKDALGRDALEIGIRKTTDGRQSYYIWNYNGTNTYIPAGNFIVSVNNNEFVYEIRIPLSSFGAEASDGAIRLCFCISAGDYTDSGRYVYVQFGRGISGFSSADNADSGKYAKLFPVATLGNSSSDITESEPISSETESHITPEPPPTKDYIPIFPIIAALICPAIIYPFVKKRYKKYK